MNITEQNRDQRIRDIYKNVQTPDSVKERINETLNAIKQQEGSAAARQIRKKHKKPLSFRKITAIAAAAALGVGGTVFAAERIYQMHLNQNGKYQSDIGISTEQALPKEVEAVEVKAGYIPEGFVFNPDKDYYVNESKDAGYYVQEPALIDEADPLSLLYVTDAETMTIDGHEAVYLSISESTDKDWRGDKLFVLYEEMDRVLPMGIWGHADKDELIKMAENIELTLTGKKTAVSGLPLWSEIVNSPEGKKAAEEPDDGTYFNEASEAQMANVHQVGDRFQVESVLKDGGSTVIQLEASVKNVQVADDLSLITNEEAIWPDTYESWKELVGPDGKLLPDTLIYGRMGDGVDSMPEIVRTEETKVKLVYAEVEYKNTGVRNEMCYADVSGGGSGSKNYIPELQPGESVTIRVAWLVNEDELDKLYLNLNGDLVFTEKGLEIGFVDLNI